MALVDRAVSALRHGWADARRGGPRMVVRRWWRVARSDLGERTIGRWAPDVSAGSERLLRLRDACAGRRCFIVGNGPSLASMDLDRLRGEHVWALNRGHLLFERLGWAPTYHVAVDQHAVVDNREAITALGRDWPETVFFLPIQYRWGRYLGPGGDNTCWIRTRRLDIERLDEAASSFSIDEIPRRGTYTGYTVVLPAVQLALYLGFDSIYLIGCDNTYSVPEGATFEGSAANGMQTYRAGGPDPNHFDPAYHRPGHRFVLPPEGHHERTFAFANRIVAAAGARIQNATAGGRLEEFERIDFRSLFGP